MEVIILFGTFFVLLFMGVPIGFSIGIATTISLAFFSDTPLFLITQNAITGVDSFPLMAIPFFILAGNLMSSGGIARRLIDFASKLVSSITGGLGMVVTLSSMFFAAISGSAVATTSGIGSFMIPEMEKNNYDKSFSASLVAASGTIGVIIPPSIPYVIYGVAVGCSIRDLFVAGFIPGIIMGVLLLIVVYFYSKKMDYGVKSINHKTKLIDIWISFKSSFWALLSPLIVLGGIYSGMVTPTEAAVVSAIYAFIIGVFVYKELDLKGIYKAFYNSIVINGITTYMIGFSMAFSSYISLHQIPGKIANGILNITDNKFLIFILINIFLIFVGCFIDNIPATIILAPILLPIVTKFGMSPVTFGIVLTMNLAIGFITPPYGINLFVASAIAGISIESMLKTMKWFLLALLISLIIVTYIPATTMLIINLLF